MVAYYLILSFLYYHRDISVVSDDLYDRICKDLLEQFDRIKHPHKHLVDPVALKAGTGFHMTEEDYPLRVVGAAEYLLWKFKLKKEN